MPFVTGYLLNKSAILLIIIIIIYASVGDWTRFSVVGAVLIKALSHNYFANTRVLSGVSFFDHLSFCSDCLLLVTWFVQERYVMSVADLISLSMLLSITPAVREAVSRNDHKGEYGSG